MDRPNTLIFTVAGAVGEGSSPVASYTMVAESPVTHYLISASGDVATCWSPSKVCRSSNFQSASGCRFWFQISKFICNCNP